MKVDLVLVDTPVFQGERPGGVDPEHRHARKLDERAEAFVNEASIAREWRQEATEHIKERYIVISWDAEHLVPAITQSSRNSHASRNCSVRARCVKSPLMTMRSGFNSSIWRSTASTRRRSCAPKCKSERWSDASHGARTFQNAPACRSGFRNSTTATAWHLFPCPRRASAQESWECRRGQQGGP